MTQIGGYVPVVKHGVRAPELPEWLHFEVKENWRGKTVVEVRDDRLNLRAKQVAKSPVVKDVYTAMVAAKHAATAKSVCTKPGRYGGGQEIETY